MEIMWLKTQDNAVIGWLKTANKNWCEKSEAIKSLKGRICVKKTK